MHEAPEIIKELVEKFERNFKAYKNPEYKEEQLKQEFLNPFFKALGWDVDNTSNAAPQYRDVIFEDSIKVAGGTKAPDYCFTLSGRRMFFVEAKKPSVNLKEGIKPAYQLRRYAWSAKLPLSILTDFEEFAIYESRTRPKKTDRTSTGRIMYLTYKEYVEKWDEIYSIFSYEAVRNGSFDNYAEGTKKKRGTQEVDDAFLSEIETWREILAKNLALRNKELTVEELNYSVQQIIDRIIFLRMAEDRGIEKYGKLLKLLTVEEIYDGFCEMCKDADVKYNSGLFNFKEEKGREHPDKLTLNLNIDNGVLRTILKSLYYPDSPYEFSVLSSEILGNVYEQFLGKIIRLTPSHMAKVEEKPEVKKAGGVYYTPQFIVDYIVENTVGRLCNGSTPNKVSELKILDPACGSGSFLLGTYTYLLKWHLDYYSNLKDKNRLKDKIYKGKDSEWHLTIQEKKKILLNNIYGVDIDSQAVEVTKLSLLLKVLEGENRDVIEAQQKLFKERALPDLENNIKCGNSLIGPEIYDTINLLGREDIQHINAFDWENEFPEIMLNGGFEAVIGNPPYGALLTKNENSYFLKKFELQNYQLDTYFLFVEKSLHLLKNNGLFGMIIPNTWLLNLKTDKIRDYIFNESEIMAIIHHRFPVFPKATVDTEIVILNNKNPNEKHQISIKIVEKNGRIDEYSIPQKRWISKNGNPVNIFERPEFMEIADKMREYQLLDEICTIRQGTKPFQVGKGKPPQTRKIVDEKPYVSDKKVDSTFRPLLRGSLIQKYQNLWNNDYWISFGDWLAEPRYSANYDASEKIIIRQTGDSPIATLDCSQFIVRDNLYAITPKNNTANEINFKYILGILNSTLIKWFYQMILNPEKGEALAQVKRGHIAQLPIYMPDFDKSVDKYNKMIVMVEKMLQLNKDLKKANIPSDIKLIQRQIDATNKQIDNLVYELYGLTDEEIRIINSSI